MACTVLEELPLIVDDSLIPKHTAHKLRCVESFPVDLQECLLCFEALCHAPVSLAIQTACYNRHFKLQQLAFGGFLVCRKRLVQ